MKVFFTYQGIDEKHFYELDVSSSITVAELIKFKEINEIILSLNHELIISVNSELLDGDFKPLPHKYRLKEGERVELLRPLNQDPKERRLKKI
jgi:putative ubiquitin-RnfH superfamily antitoxin RatB of RatAB toxin-antitoxin module|tara:strand:- start:3377 stop:3655 length:279 start_codon:yes stop_codon:yes gene_type:complete